jgi:pimeloyl-ACP methyl ester carboxylesterase
MTVVRKALYHSSSPRCTLHHEWIGSKPEQQQQQQQDSTIVFLHGLLGNGKNLKTMAKKVVAAKNASGVLVDLRGHGQSPSPSGPHTFDACVNDVHTTLPSSIVPSCVMGHSWGGRIALQYVHSLLENANDSNRRLPELWLLDTVPGQAHESVEQVLEAVQRIQDLSNKAKVAHQLEQEYGLQRGVAQWLAASLQPNGDSFKWGFDVEVATSVLPEFQRQDFIGMVRNVVKEGGRVHLVRGGANPAWNESSSTLVSQLHELEQNHKHEFQVHTLPKAGHWVHVDDLPGLLELVVDPSE